MISLRPYQESAVVNTLAGFTQFGKQLIVVPTGGGKTLIFSEIARRMQPARALILAHREELIDQAIAKLYGSTGITAQKEKAEWRASQSADCVVASVQTMAQRLERWPADHFGLVVADEAHHAISPSWQRVLRHFDGHAKVLGVTATADRGDKRNLGEYFENVPVEVALFDLVHAGFLSRISVRSIPLQIDLRAVRQSMGDFSEADLGGVLAPYLPAIAKAIREEAGFRRTLVFVPLVATSKAFVESCKREGISAAHVDGTSPDRKEILERFAAGEFELLSNAMLLTEGFDDPGIDCVVILRPTKSRPLYSQMVGRGTRIAPHKRDLLLLDFLWLHEKHNLIRPAHLVAKTEEEAEEITALAIKPGGESQDEFDLEGLASEARQQREDRLKEALAAKANRKAKSIDALEFCLSLHADSETTEYEPTMKWEREKVSNKQREIIEKCGINVESITCKGHASKIIDLIFSRSKLNLATPKQVKFLKRFNFPNPHIATFDQASSFLDKVWKKSVSPKSSSEPAQV